MCVCCARFRRSSATIICVYFYWKLPFTCPASSLAFVLFDVVCLWHVSLSLSLLNSQCACVCCSVILYFYFLFFTFYFVYGPYVCVLYVKSVFWICSDKSIWRELYLLFVPIHSFISSSHWILLSNIQLNLQAVDQYQYAHMDSMLCIHFQWYFVFCVFFRSVFSIHW